MSKNVKCLICGSAEYKVLYKPTIEEANEEINPKHFSVFADRRHGQIVSCKQCGFVYVNPRESETIFFNTYEKLSPKEYLLEQENRELVFKENIELIERFIKKRGKLLDIGCSVGLFLKVARERGWVVKGVEPSLKNTDFAKREFYLDVINGNVNFVDFGNEKFDVVTMWDVLEHLSDPDKVISKIHSLLDKDVIFVLSTPNIKSTIAKIMRQKWHSIIRMHLYYFDENTLSLFLKKHGFKIIYRGTYRRIFTLNYIVKRMEYHSKLLAFFFNILLLRMFNVGQIRIPINLHDELLIIAKKI